VTDRPATVRAHPVAAVIVGAGAGKRFGGPKAIATLPDGRRFLDAIAQVAGDAGLHPIVAVLPPGVQAPPGLRVVVNPDPGSEQIASIRLGLAQLTSQPVVAAVVWPVDHPFVALESVLAILDGARRTNALIVVPTHGGRRGHPTFFHRDAWRELMTTNDGGARAVIHANAPRVADIEVHHAGVLRGVNTPADLA
jgi:molybdenum cofactor cytidylyltransferase